MSVILISKFNSVFLSKMNNILSDDDEEIVMFIARPRRPKVYRDRHNYFNLLDDYEFFKRFRLTKNTVQMILNQIKDLITSTTNRNHAISPSTKLLLTLRFYALGTMLLAVGDFTGVSKSSACIIVKEVSAALASLRSLYINFPQTPEETENTMIGFYKIARFPQVIGAVDCTHIRIQSPGGDQAEYFRNRKGFFSWNVQAICDSTLKIQDIVARWPGSSHDQTIFSNSVIRRKFETGEMGSKLLLGDGGYGVTKYLIPPLLHPVTDVETLFNESQIRTRNPIERCFGVLTRRFPILSVGMRVCLVTTQAIIVATAILHNIAILEREEVPPLDPELIINHNNIEYVDDNPDATNTQIRNDSTRRSLINNYFRQIL